VLSFYEVWQGFISWFQLFLQIFGQCSIIIHSQAYVSCCCLPSYHCFVDCNCGQYQIDLSHIVVTFIVQREVIIYDSHMTMYEDV
jgi:hypothetical protein